LSFFQYRSEGPERAGNPAEKPFFKKFSYSGLFTWECSAWRGEGSGDLINVPKYRQGGSKEDTARHFAVAPSDKTRGNGHTLKQEVPSERLETLFHCGGDHALPTSLPPLRYSKAVWTWS